MGNWKAQIRDALGDFVCVARLARDQVRENDFEVEYLRSSHKRPKRLPICRMAVYAFRYRREWLKIGIAGPNSGARYTTHHYNPRAAKSTLAASLLGDRRMRVGGERGVGKWIENNTHRVNILLGSEHGMLLLKLLEAFLHVRLKPRYEE